MKPAPGLTLAFVLLAALSLTAIALLPTAQIRPAPEADGAPPHNYIEFRDRFGRTHAKYPELNGWLLLEALLRRDLGSDDPDLSEKLLSRFERNGLYGWWPADLISAGKPYFRNKDPIRLVPDLDDTSWGRRYFRTPLDDSIFDPFLSSGELPPAFKSLCQEIGCDRRYLLRVWADREWHQELDIVTAANAISRIPVNASALGEKIFEENRRLVDRAIERHEPERYFRFFFPEETGYFLLLYYDRTGRPFLSDASKKILLKKIERRLPHLKKRPIYVGFSAGDSRPYGYDIVTYNDKIVGLMNLYAERNLYEANSLSDGRPLHSSDG